MSVWSRSALTGINRVWPPFPGRAPFRTLNRMEDTGGEGCGLAWAEAGEGSARQLAPDQRAIFLEPHAVMAMRLGAGRNEPVVEAFSST